MFLNNLAQKKNLQVLIISILLTYLRDSRFFLHPRIWAEEGTIYLMHSIKYGFHGIFFPNVDQTASIDYINYYSFLPNLATFVASRFFPIEYAAHITTYFSALFQLLTVLIIFKSVNSFISNKNLCIFVALTPIIFSSVETWVNSINIQFWFTTGILFILSSNKISKFDLFYSLIGFFTSVGSLFLIPFLFLRFFKENNSKNHILALLIFGTAGFLFQCFALLSSFEFNSRFKIDLFKNLPRGLGSSLIPRIVYISDPLGPNSSESLYDNSTILIFTFFLILMIVSIFVCLKKFKKFNFRFKLLYPIMAYWFISTLTSLNMSGGERYGLPVYCGIFYIIILAFESSPNILIKRLILFSTLFLFTLRIFVFFETEKYYGSSWLNWRDQVLEYERNPKKNIKIFPQWDDSSIWEVDINSVINK